MTVAGAFVPAESGQLVGVLREGLILDAARPGLAAITTISAVSPSKCAGRQEFLFAQ